MVWAKAKMNVMRQAVFGQYAPGEPAPPVRGCLAVGLIPQVRQIQGEFQVFIGTHAPVEHFGDQRGTDAEQGARNIASSVLRRILATSFRRRHRRRSTERLVWVELPSRELWVARCDTTS